MHMRLTLRPWPTIGCTGIAVMCVWALQDGRTALMWAAFSGKALIMALLLDRGAALEAKDKVSPATAPAVSRSSDVVWGRAKADCSAGRGLCTAWVVGPGGRSEERRVGGGVWPNRVLDACLAVADVVVCWSDWNACVGAAE